MNTQANESLKLSERAAQWLGRLLEGDVDSIAFFNWLAESPRHVEEFLSTLALAQEITELKPEQRTRIEALAMDERAPAALSASVVPWSSDTARVVAPVERSTPYQNKRHVHRRRWQRVSGIAAGVLLLAGTAWFMAYGGAQTYTTAVGEQRIIKLPDGSTVHLNTDSRLKVRYTAKARTLNLIEGQALFRAQGNPARPFRVSSGDITIEAIGTEFDVYRRRTGLHPGTRVAVVQGAVRVAPGGVAVLLKAGETADITAGGKSLKRETLALADATAWQQRRLVFREETLGAIAAEFNRYNSSVQIEVLGKAATQEHFSGTFDADAPEKLIQALEDDNTLSVERRGNLFTVRSRTHNDWP